MYNPIIYPRLAVNQIIEIQGEKYRAEMWHHKGAISYEFIYLGENGLRNFVRSEQQVSDAIKKGLIN